MNSTIVGLVAAIAVLSGGLGLSLTDGFDDQKYITSNTATGFLIGQVEIEARNADGELFAYRQSDNAVVDDGEQCILKMLFGSTGETDAGRGEYLATTGNGGITADAGACTGILTGAWDVIAIGTGTTSVGTVAEHDLFTGLEIECNAVGNDGNSDGDFTDVGDCLAAATTASKTLVRATATTKTWTNGTGATGTEIVLAKTFTSGVTASITESGLFNSTGIGTGGMLSHKTFAAVSLTSGDSITVTWTFTVGN